MTSSRRQSPCRLAVDDALAAPSTTTSCHMQQPSLDVDGGADRHAVNILRHRTATGHQRLHATDRLHLAPPSSTSHGVGRAAVVASDRQGSDANCWRHLSLQHRFFFYLELPHTTLHLSQATLLLGGFPQEHSHTQRTHIPRKRNGFARDTPLVNHNGYMVSLLSPLGLFF
ncbi:hypothetical protein CFC21_039363 [Triticum aestivum]|uniref:Uncharacterized protein n=2 Tax=Triticum aestivum TaxID=4565 RepID=A0A3B6FGF4_WHEAT|nr:hypothetical protein CFC21_039363 [Triticum aestivum]